MRLKQDVVCLPSLMHSADVKSPHCPGHVPTASSMEHRGGTEDTPHEAAQAGISRGEPCSLSPVQDEAAGVASCCWASGPRHAGRACLKLHLFPDTGLRWHCQPARHRWGRASCQALHTAHLSINSFAKHSYPADAVHSYLRKLGSLAKHWAFGQWTRLKGVRFSFLLL